MKKIAAMVTVIILVFGTYAVSGAASAPGTEADPVVTKSYVDSEIAKIKSAAGGGAAFTAVFVNAGKKVLGGDGTELILRSGEATSISNAENGVADLTEGKDLMGTQQIIPNHLLMVPRNDGRGITAVTDIWIMAKGSYTVK